MLSFGIQLDTTKLQAFPEEFARKVEQVIAQTLAEAEGIAADHAHMITGSMRAGLYTATHEESGYGAAAAAAAALNPKAEIAPEVAPPGPGHGILADAVAHAQFEEFGTSTRPAHPFMTPAALAAESIFVEKLEDMGRSL